MRITIAVSVLIIVVLIVLQLSKSVQSEKEVTETTDERKGLLGEVIEAIGISSLF